MLKKIITFIRWRLVIIRYITMLFNLRKGFLNKKFSSKLNSSFELKQFGYTSGVNLTKNQVDEILNIYKIRTKDLKFNEFGAPFINLISAKDIKPEDPIMKYTFSKEVLDSAIDYFGGKLILDSIQLLYSWPTSGDLRESQKWHLDYGDSKSFHCITYLNDVDNYEKGPFVYINKSDSKKIKWSPFIRRIQDEQIQKELNSKNKINYFIGNAGDSIFVDPAVCYHYGSRCKIPRMALFITFNTNTPFVAPTKLIKDNKSKLYQVAKIIRPELNDEVLKNIIGI